MPLASCLSLHLARFDQVRPAGATTACDRPGVLFCAVAADTRAAGTKPASQVAFAFAMLALHTDEDSAHRLVDDRLTVAPWLGDAREVWGAVLQPYRHKGCANHLDPSTPGPLFDGASLPGNTDGPLVAITSAGWNTGDSLDMNRVREFSTGVLAVRVSMTAVPGLHSQQSFFFPGVLAIDPITVSFWRDDAAVRAFAYEQGSHRRQMDRHRAEQLADRTSFTRCRVVRSDGTWCGSVPA